MQSQAGDNLLEVDYGPSVVQAVFEKIYKLDGQAVYMAVSVAPAPGKQAALQRIISESLGQTKHPDIDIDMH